MDRIETLSTPKIIAVSGFGGSGKSSFSEKLGKVLGVPVVGIDSFQKDSTTVEFSFWETMDFPRFEKEVLLSFVNRDDYIRYTNFQWDGSPSTEVVEVKVMDTLIVEGVGIFRPELLKYFDLKIWIDCPLDEAEARGMKRDKEVHDNVHDSKWYQVWRANDEQYYETFRPKETADLLVDNT